jgi:putative ATP-dependent endonuclease of OLD family
MTLVRSLLVENFRCIKSLSWLPEAGVNCLVGPGDSGKSTVIDALDFCIGARRSLQLTDADFHEANTGNSIKIQVTLGALPDELKNFDIYGIYLQGFDRATGRIEPEPRKTLETVLTVQLLIQDDLEPQWTLVSERAMAQGLTRSMSWKDRQLISPTRLGIYNDVNLTWRRGSALTRLTDERADPSIEIAKALRDTRAVFQKRGSQDLKKSLSIVTEIAKHLGLPVGNEVTAGLDAWTLSSTGGTVSLHDDKGLPLRNLGLGSTRLLLAGIQRQAAANSSVVLMDELEHGLEPHRVILLLNTLGSKESPAPLQTFLSTHSPAAIRELSGPQLFVLRMKQEKHVILSVGTANEAQGSVRKFPEALLARTILVCEGASEVGFVRGIDQHRANAGASSISSYGTTLIDGGGNEVFKRAIAFQSLGFRTAVLRDSDVTPTPELEKAFTASGGKVFCWRSGHALEDEMFYSLDVSSIGKLIALAVDEKDEELVDAHIKSASKNHRNLASIREELATNASAETRKILGLASRHKDKKGWYKSVTIMEQVAREVIAPNLTSADPGMRAVVENLFAYLADG